MLTERDGQILQFINEFGFCELKHLMKRFSINESNCYKIMKRLTRHEWVIHDRIFHKKPGVYYLTRNGAQHTDLPALEHIPQIQYQHQLKIIDVYIQHMVRQPHAHWISKRRLIKDQNQKDIKKKKHFADGILLFPDGSEIAIEVELSLKGKNRLEKIFKAYAGQHDIVEVWYFCLPQLVAKLKKLAEKRSFIKIYNILELLS